jgi:hypothetical protein
MNYELLVVSYMLKVKKNRLEVLDCDLDNEFWQTIYYGTKISMAH